MTPENRKNTYALVTGASSGIGFEYARQLLDYGYNLVAVSNEDAIYAKADELAAVHPELKVIPVLSDLARTEAADELYAFCKERGLEVEVLVNNAGIYHNCDFLDDSAKYNSLIMLLHVYTPTMLMYNFAKDMVARGKGYILNMSSVTSAFSVQRIGIYCSTKAYLRGISRSTHVELREKGVVVTCVRPGAVSTPLYNLSPSARRVGLFFGYIITPEKLARKGLKAMFRGRSSVTPGLYTKLLNALVVLIPTWALKLVRKLRIY